MRYVCQVLNGMLQPNNDMQAIDNFGVQMKDGWYVGLEDETDGPYHDEATAIYVKFFLEQADRLLHHADTDDGPTCDAKRDLRSYIMQRVEDLLV